MRRAALLLLLALPAGAGEITFWDGAALRTATDPHATIPALRTEPQSFAALAGEDVGLLIEPAAGAPVYVSNLIAGAVVRRFSGHLEARRALSAERLLALAPVVSLSGEEAVVDWRVYDERRAPLAAFRTRARMSGEGRGLAAFTPEDAERLAFQTAAMLEEAVNIADQEAHARIGRTPTPLSRPMESAQ